MTATHQPEPAMLELISRGFESAFPFIERVGIEVVELEPRRVVMKAPLAPNVNHVGTMYAGALYTLAELPGGAIAMGSFDPAKYYPLVKHMDISFLRMAKTDVTVEVVITEDEQARIQAVVDEHGKADFSWTCELKDADGVVVCTSTNDYQLRAHQG